MKKVRKMLVIDDDYIMLHGVKLLVKLHNLDFELETFSYPSEALDHLKTLKREEWPDLLLVDVNLPVMNGWEFLDELRKLDNKWIKDIYILSSSIDPADRENLTHYPEVMDFLPKPLSLENIFRVTSACAA